MLQRHRRLVARAGAAAAASRCGCGRARGSTSCWTAGSPTTASSARPSTAGSCSSTRTRTRPGSAPPTTTPSATRTTRRRSPTRSSTCSRRPPRSCRRSARRGSPGPSGALRTTLHARGPNEDALSREHELVDHAAEGAAGLLSFVGGKLATYRAQAEEVTDRILALLGRAAGGLPDRRGGAPGRRGGRPTRRRWRPASAWPGRWRRGWPTATGPGPRRCSALRRGSAPAAAGLPRGRAPRRRGGPLRPPRAGAAAAGPADPLPAGGGRLRRARLRPGGGPARGAGARLGPASGPAPSWPTSWRSGWRERRAVLDGAQLAQEELLRGAHWGVGR